MTGFAVLPRRWLVERSLAWICLRRRCIRDYEQLPEHHEVWGTWSMVMPMTRRLARTPTTGMSSLFTGT
jgi:transposase